MIFNLSHLKSQSNIRPSGYMEEVLALSIYLGKETYQLSDDMYLQLAQKYQKSTFGLGDVVASITQPIAKGIDKIIGTNIAECGGCKRRQSAMNKLIPNINLIRSDKTDSPKP